MRFLQTVFLSCFLLFSQQASAQLLIDKSLDLSDYPQPPDEYRNYLLETGIDDSYIKKHNVKVLTQLIAIKDTSIKLQEVHYGKDGKPLLRHFYFYGQLESTEFLDWDSTKRTLTVHNETRENRFHRFPGRVIQYDAFGNPVKYIFNQDLEFRHTRVPDSVLYTYRYDRKGRVQEMQELKFEKEQPPLKSIHTYTYNTAGNPLVHTIKRGGELLFQSERTYATPGFVKKISTKYPRYELFDNRDLYYTPSGVLGVIKQHSKQEVMDLPFDRLIEITYDEAGRQIKQTNLQKPEKEWLKYTYEFY